MWLRPVGSLPANVYWRRRVLLLALVLGLIVAIGYVVWPSGAHPRATAQSVAAPASTSPAATAPAGRPAPAQRSTSPEAPAATPAVSSTGAPATAAAGHAPSGGTAVASCRLSDLTIAAATSAPSYPLGSQPQLFLQVTNSTAAPCSTDLADPQVELRIYNGAARVWGSHDCMVQPGSKIQTLLPNQPVRLSITWTGLSSEPGCAGTRTAVPAGTYTLYALLAGKQGSPAQFTLQ